MRRLGIVVAASSLLSLGACFSPDYGEQGGHACDLRFGEKCPSGLVCRNEGARSTCRPDGRTTNSPEVQIVALRPAIAGLGTDIVDKNGIVSEKVGIPRGTKMFFTVKTVNFTISGKKKEGTTPIAGEGHYHIRFNEERTKYYRSEYVTDGTTVPGAGVIKNPDLLKATFTIPEADVAPEIVEEDQIGTDFRVTLHNNDHSPIVPWTEFSVRICVIAKGKRIAANNPCGL